MLNNTQQFPSMEEFKLEAKQLKINKNFDKLGHAQNSLAQKYGFKDYNAIKAKLIEADSLFNKLPGKIQTYQLRNGGIVNSQGLYKTKDGYATNASSSNSYTPKQEVKKALYFIDNVMEKRKTVNLQGSTSYGLKHHVEKFIEHYNLFKEDSGYVSNAAFIIALDIRGYKIKEIFDEYGQCSLNINTNYKSFRGNFYDKLNHGDFDYSIKLDNKLPIFKDIMKLEENNFQNSKNIPSHHFDILENRNTAKSFFEYFSIFIYHMIKAMSLQNEKKFYFTVNKNELSEKFSYMTYDNKLVINTIKEDMLLTNKILGVFPNVFYDNELKSFVIYWDNKNNINIKLPINHTSKSYLEYDTFFHKFNDDNKLEKHGIIKHMDDNMIYITYDYEDTIFKISLNNLENFIFYDNRKFRDNIHKLVNEASKLEKHQFFNSNKSGYLLAKDFMLDNKNITNFILEKICGYNLNTI